MRPLSPAAIRFLASPPAQKELTGLAGGELEPLATLARLRKAWGGERAAWLYDQALLRRRARDKFPHAEALLFESEALEQASHRLVASWRAREVFGPYARVADLGAGIGGDALALAAAGKRVLAVERDPLRAAILRHNAAALGLAARIEVVEADWRGLQLQVDAAFADPARRSGGRRTVHLDAMEPPFADVAALAARLPAVAVKLAPALVKGELPVEAGLGFVSLGGELKEALAGLGELAWPQPWAAVLPAGERLFGPEPQEERLAGPQAYLYEPDAAVIRAGLVRRLAAELQAAQLDAQVAYLTAASCRQTPLARCWRVLRHGPYHFKTLRGWLQELEGTATAVKRRHSPIEPAELAKKLPRAGARSLTVLLTRIGGRNWMMLAEEPS